MDSAARDKDFDPMKGPFRYQAAAGDCFPTSVVNGLTALYPFYDIPSAVIQHVYLYALDDDSPSGGTTDEAGKFLATWLSRFRRKGFKIEAEFLEGRDVDVKPRGRIARHLARGGVAVYDTYSASGARHTVLALGMEREWMYCWDPRYRPRAIRSTRSAETLRPATPEKPNLRVRRGWLEQSAAKAYALGPLRDRCAILLARG
jgi:hypothetical protein